MMPPLIDPSETSATDETYNIWRLKNPTKRPYLDANKLANIRREIITDAELDDIKTNTS